MKSAIAIVWDVERFIRWVEDHAATVNHMNHSGWLSARNVTLALDTKPLRLGFPARVIIEKLLSYIRHALNYGTESAFVNNQITGFYPRLSSRLRFDSRFSCHS